MIFFSMSKGTKSFGHDKALACESRGFVYNKKGCIVLTHPPFWLSLFLQKFIRQQQATSSPSFLRSAVEHFGKFADELVGFGLGESQWWE